MTLHSLLWTFELITDSYSVSGTNQPRKVRIESVVRKASDSDFVIFNDVRKTKNLSGFDSIFFIAPVNIAATEEEECIWMFGL